MSSTHDLIAGYCNTCHGPVRLWCSECAAFMYHGERHKKAHRDYAAMHSEECEATAVFYCQCRPQTATYGQRPHRYQREHITEHEFPFALAITRVKRE